MVRAVAIIMILVATAACEPMRADAPARAVEGTIVLPERVALPADTEMILQIDAADGRRLAEARGRTDGRQGPLPFRLLMPAGPEGALRARLEAPDHRVWESGTIAIEPGDAEAVLGEVALSLAGAPVPEVAAAAEEGDASEEAQVVAALTEPEPPAPQEPAVAVAELRFLCGEDVVRARLSNGAATVTVAGIDVEMEAAQAASGARYEVPGDPATFFWERGDSALIGLAGVTLPECQRAGPAQ